MTHRTYYTIRHADTHKPLGTGGALDRNRAIELLHAARPTPLVKTDWYVTEWHGCGSDTDPIICQMSADEWLSLNLAAKAEGGAV